MNIHIKFNIMINNKIYTKYEGNLLIALSLNLPKKSLLLQSEYVVYGSVLFMKHSLLNSLLIITLL